MQKQSKQNKPSTSQRAAQSARDRQRNARNKQVKQKRSRQQIVRIPQLGYPGEMASAPVAMGKVSRTGKPDLRSLRNGDCRIKHREYIQDVVAATGNPSAFSVSLLAINPGQSAVFPWLSQVAQRFESYKFDMLKFCYETEAPSSLGGTLVLAVDYDASDPAPTNKQQALAYRGSVRSPPWEACCHTSLKEDLSKLKSHFVRPGAIPPSTDIKLYDVGNLDVITQGVTTSGAACGELYVEYDVLLMTPVLEPLVTAGTLTTTASTAAAPFGTSQISLGNITLSGAAGVLTISGLVPGSEYYVSMLIPNTSCTGMAITTVTGASDRANGPTLVGTSVASASKTVTAVLGTATFNVVATALTSSSGMYMCSLIPTSAL